MQKYRIIYKQFSMEQSVNCVPMLNYLRKERTKIHFAYANLLSILLSARISLSINLHFILGKINSQIKILKRKFSRLEFDIHQSCLSNHFFFFFFCLSQMLSS